ncbi:MAG: penicillin acylase family protein, partial [Candidatus Heimdallarchaeota archaeon]|nr:penicillin acylase family protein [Candidatus Heimdallarchaeota archaeon]MCK5048955.1 penicillin acylase family protein [Candidatus Heimdallarchaeota archaeon]
GLLLSSIVGGLFFGKKLAIQNTADYIPATFDSIFTTDPVKVYRDTEGMPHVYGSDYPSIYLAMGYVTAQDRLWQLELLRRLVSGEISALLGEDFVDLDILMISLNLLKASEKNFALYSDDEKVMMEAYVSGINYFINTHTYFPYEFLLHKTTPQEWSVYDSLAIPLLFEVGKGIQQAQKEIARIKLLENHDHSSVLELLPIVQTRAKEAFLNTNYSDYPSLTNSFKVFSQLEAFGIPLTPQENHVIFTVSNISPPYIYPLGYPYIINEFSTPLVLPSMWYPIGYRINPSDRNPTQVTGMGLTGFPGVFVGHNIFLGWGISHSYIDDIDVCFFEENDQGEYYLQGWNEYSTKINQIKVKGGKTLEFISKETPLGPMVELLENKFFCLNWSIYRPSNLLNVLQTFEHAENLTYFSEGLDGLKHASYYVSVSEVYGMIWEDILDDGNREPINYLHGGSGWFITGSTRSRENQDFGLWLINGSLLNGSFEEFIQISDLPRDINANENVVVLSGNSLYNKDTVSFLIDPIGLSEERRASNLEAAYLELDSLNVTTSSAVFENDFCYEFEQLMELIGNLSEEMDTLSSIYFDRLSNWSGYLSDHNELGAIYNYWRNYLTLEVFSKLDSSTLGLILPYATSELTSILNNSSSTWLSESRDEVLLSSFKKAVKHLISLGDPEWHATHEIIGNHIGNKGELFDRKVKLMATSDGLRYALWHLSNDSKLSVKQTVSMRLIIHPTNSGADRFLNCTYQLLFGSSGHLLNENYDSGIKYAEKNEFISLLFYNKLQMQDSRKSKCVLILTIK